MGSTASDDLGRRGPRALISDLTGSCTPNRQYLHTAIFVATPIKPVAKTVLVARVPAGSSGEIVRAKRVLLYTTYQPFILKIYSSRLWAVAESYFTCLRILEPNVNH